MARGPPRPSARSRWAQGLLLPSLRDRCVPQSQPPLALLKCPTAARPFPRGQGRRQRDASDAQQLLAPGIPHRHGDRLAATRTRDRLHGRNLLLHLDATPVPCTGEPSKIRARRGDENVRRRMRKRNGAGASPWVPIAPRHPALRVRQPHGRDARARILRGRVRRHRGFAAATSRHAGFTAHRRWPIGADPASGQILRIPGAGTRRGLERSIEPVGLALVVEAGRATDGHRSATGGRLIAGPAAREETLDG